MTSGPWQISDHVATLRTPELRATVDPRKPAAGLVIEKLGEQSTAGIALFGVQIDSSADFDRSPISTAAISGPSSGAVANSADAPFDCFIRGNDLVATYAETTDRPFRAQVYWRLVEPLATAARNNTGGQGEYSAASAIAGVELIVSVQTSRLDVETAIAVCSTIGHVESWQLLDADDRAMSDGAASANTPQSASATVSGAGDTVVPDFYHSGSRDCCLVRPAGLSAAYLEMVHPSDFRQTTFEWASQSPPVVRLTHRLFAERLEKGVILRSRIRGLFIPRIHADEQARQEYRRFADSKLPLTA